MIVLVEGPRGAGKTHLLNKFFEQNTNPKIEYYKWYLVDWIKTLGLESREQRKEVHYLSVGNILTILDQMKNRNDKVIVFDRALLTAYVWAYLRGRLTKPQCEDEIVRILKSDSYKNIITVFINPNTTIYEKDERNKDLWDNLHSKKEEYDLFEDYTIDYRLLLEDRARNNHFYNFFNEFDTKSEEIFVGLFNGFSDFINI